MSPKTIQVWIRSLGTLLGITGLAAIIAYFIVSKQPATNAIPAGILPLGVLVAALFRAAYLSWFRWSALAIRHVVGGVFFFITMFCLFFVPNHVPTGWGAFCFFYAFPVCYAAYWIVALILSRYAFPASSNPHSPDNSHHTVDGVT